MSALLALAAHATDSSEADRIKVQIMELMYPEASILLFLGRYKLIRDIPSPCSSITKLPIMLKGVLTQEDAVKAVDVRVDGIIVSNHGGRQLDYVRAIIDALEEVVVAVEGRIPVLFYGGIRRGTDVFNSLAVGAKAVLIGRPVVYGLAAKGQYGVKKVIDMLKDELELTMALSGCPNVNDITRNHVRTQLDNPHLYLYFVTSISTTTTNMTPAATRGSATSYIISLNCHF